MKLTTIKRKIAKAFVMLLYTLSISKYYKKKNQNQNKNKSQHQKIEL